MPAKQLAPNRIFFYDVDTQRDFLLPGGALYVTGAERIVPALERLTLLARRLHIRRLCSTDRHFAGDAELKRNGGDWPDHCMDGTPGQLKVEQTAPIHPSILPNEPIEEARFKQILEADGDLVIEKQDVDLLRGNRYAQRTLEWLVRRYDQAIVYGVFTEICVDRAVQALLLCGHRPLVVNDAIYPVNARAAQGVLARWQQAEIKVLSIAQLESRLAQ
ncbi:MAG TPA: isochorismatase family protein [Candidatus Binataceae bacterium]|nr:isochorismatase family protein [Candidatus Binataceae bacterium]